MLVQHNIQSQYSQIRKIIWRRKNMKVKCLGKEKRLVLSVANYLLSKWTMHACFFTKQSKGLAHHIISSLADQIKDTLIAIFYLGIIEHKHTFTY